MTQFFGRLLQRPETARVFDADNDLIAPDEYTRKFVAMEDGAITFVEIAPEQDGPWSLWRIECVGFLPQFRVTGYAARRCSEAEALAEVRMHVS